MSAWLGNEQHLRSYLLGDLDSDAQERIELRLMTDSAAFQELQLAEDELIDDYIEDVLSDSERLKFENFFLAAPERRQQLGFSQALKRYIAEHKLKEGSGPVWAKPLPDAWHRPSPFLRWSLAASLFLLIAGGVWSAVQISNLRKELEQAGLSNLQKQLMETRIRNSELTSALQHEQARLRQLERLSTNRESGDSRGYASSLQGPMRPALISVTLAPGLLRASGGIQKVRIPAGTDLAQFDLKMEPQDFARYQATLQPVDGNILWTQISPLTGSGPGSRFFRLIVPAHLLPPGDFVLKLSGIDSNGVFEAIGNYYFHIVP